MTIALYCMLYAGVLVFAAGCIVRAVSYAGKPIHLRWEIYPVPHGKTGELKVMVPEILFLKGLWEFNRPMWWVSYPFHLGLYLIAAAAVLLAGSALAPAFLLPVLHGACVVCGTAGPALGLLGASGLMIRRLSAHDLKPYNAPGDFFNLALFICTTILILTGVWLRPPGSPGPGAILQGRRYLRRHSATVAASGRRIHVGMRAAGLHPHDAHVPLHRQVFHLPHRSLGRARQRRRRDHREENGRIPHVSAHLGGSACRRQWRTKLG